MAISLAKGQKVSVTKENPGLENVVVGLGWDINQFDTGSEFDLDTSAFMLGENGKCPTDNEFIFFGNKVHSTNSVQHLGDNRTGEGDGDDEKIKIKLSAVPADIAKIVFTATIYEGEQKNQNFGQVDNSFIRIYNEDNGEEILRYDLGEDFSIETAIVFGELYRHNGEWKFNAIGGGYQGGLATICSNFGIDAE